MKEVSPKRPKYLQLVEHIRSEINAGRFEPGKAIPIEANLADSFGMARNTVRQGLARLEQEGIIHRVQGRGTFVTTPRQRVARKQLEMFALIADQLREGTYPSLVHGFEGTCKSIQYQAIVCNSNNDVHVQGDLILQMIDKDVAGVALVPVTSTPTPIHQIRQLQKHHIPVVFCHRAVSGVPAPCVTWDGEQVGRLAAEAFIERGHRRLAYLTPHRSEISDAYVRGLRYRMLEADLELLEENCCYYGGALPGVEAQPAIREVLRTWSTSKERPTAIFCGSLPDAEQIYLLAAELGWRIPEDLSLAYFGGTWLNNALAERITCVAVDAQAIGARASEILSEMRSGMMPIDSEERIVFPVTLMPGETLGPAPAE